MKRPVSLWQWVGWRMGFIASGTVALMSFIMWLRFYWWDLGIKSKIPADARVQLEKLIDHPAGHEAELWTYITKYYYVDDILPGISGADWWAVLFLLITALPIIVIAGFLLLRPLSKRFIEIAQAAQKVARGNLKVKLSIAEKMPLEVQQLTSDFNSMTQRLRLYEQEVQESSAVLAHELRTPLNAAMGRVRGMLDEVFPANEEQLGLVLHQLEHLNYLVDDLLLLSLAQAGQLPLTKTTFTVEALLNERINWFNPQLSASGRTIKVTSLALDPIAADRNRIGQVFNILLDNYLRYASSGGDLQIEGQSTPDGICLIFSDRGPGLSEEEMQRVFQRFWRQERSRDRRAGGSGLGLSIALAICAAHSGTITASQRDGGGMVFEVKLPFV
ncbi:ATP-binding protein [Pseudomonas vanderleydeniana]|uniref:histidine kinase n=1 Tax=Pseudomonas vanderleydeniana TaxID=2745495 RepID=A0A9E6TUI9_9PSED|nr:ATP-binding protein [Pseudomonas vanderleydeniana]QXI30897.1 HAMP domain-containing protein [Pseudomonas vanderleydeniana]